MPFSLPLPLLDSGAQPERCQRGVKGEGEKDTAGSAVDPSSSPPLPPHPPHYPVFRCTRFERDKKREYLCGGYLSR